MKSETLARFAVHSGREGRVLGLYEMDSLALGTGVAGILEEEILSVTVSLTHLD